MTFAQVCCDRLFLDLKDALAEVALLRKEVHAGHGHVQQISDLKLKLLKVTRSLHASQERHDRELAALRQHMDEGNDRFEAALTQAADKLQKSKSKKKKASIRPSSTELRAKVANYPMLWRLCRWNAINIKSIWLS